MRATDVVGEAWTLYRAHWRHLLAVSALVYLAIALLTLVLVVLLGLFGAFVAFFLALAGIFWVQGALVVASEDVRDGRADLSVRQTFERLRTRINTLSLLALLALAAWVAAGLLILFGLFVFVLPGLVFIVLVAYLAVRWILVVPVLMLEGTTIVAALNRSAELVRGHAWSVLRVMLLTVFVLVGAGLLIGLALAWLPEEARGPITQLVSSSLTAPFVALAWTLMYYRLREPRAVPEAA